jgi:ADP-ribose pyrophosphatase YjhB (NUDIX family)
MSTPNFQIKGEDGKNYWISRSVAVVVIPLFKCEGLTYVPLGKRSKELNLYPEHWGIPCGFLDWGESAYEAAEREVLEELGIKLSDFCFNINPQPDAVMSDPNPSENETVSLRFIVNCKVEELPELKTSSEVTEVKWMEVTRNGWKQEKLAFNHTDIIDWALCRSHIDGF